MFEHNIMTLDSFEDVQHRNIVSYVLLKKKDKYEHDKLYF